LIECKGAGAVFSASPFFSAADMVDTFVIAVINANLLVV